MPTLIELFKQHQTKLTNNLNDNATPEKVVDESKHFLDWLKSKYLTSSSPSANQQHLMPLIIELLKASLSTLVSASQTKFEQQQVTQMTPCHQSLTNKFFVLRLGQLMAVVLLAVQMWGNNEFLALIVLLALAGSELITLLPLHRLSANQSQATSIAPPLINISTYLLKLTDALFTADKILAQAVVKPSSQALEQHPLLLELLKDLLAANCSEDSACALKKTKTIPALLEQHALRAEVFNGKNHQLFEFLPNLDPNENRYKTLSPALTKDDVLISLGQVLKPKIETEKSGYI